jgi:hypothetical protein
MITNVEGERDEENLWTHSALLPQEHNLSHVLFIVDDSDIFEFS